MAEAVQSGRLSSFLLLLLITIHLLPFSSSMTASASPAINIAIDLVHVDAHLKLTHQEKAHRAVHQTHRRLANLLHRGHRAKGHHYRSTLTKYNQAASTEIPLHPANAQYYSLNLSIGTPPVSFSAYIDTGSALTWTKCESAGFEYGYKRTFNPANSSSYSGLPCSHPLCSEGCVYDDHRNCSYVVTYGGLEQTSGDVSAETITIGSITIKNVAFGCSFGESSFEETAGVVGLDRGRLSLASQLGSLIDHQFSYCLSGFKTARPSRLVLGPSPSFPSAVRGKMLSNPRYRGLYFVALEGISVGGQRLSIPDSVFQIDRQGNGGVFVDSGSTYMCLLEPAYGQVIEAFTKEIGLPVVDSSITDLHVCFKGSPSSMSIPNVTLHLENGDLHLPLENYFVVDTDNELSCLAIIRTPFRAPFSVVGSTTLQNIHVNYDLGKRLMTFTPMQCDQQ